MPRRVSRPKMLELLGTIRLLKKCDSEAPEDIEPALNVLYTIEDGMQAVLQGV